MSEAKGNNPAPDQTQADAKPQGKPKAESGNDGFVAGLQFWVVFLVAFVLLQFPLALAIAFGAIAGLAGGFCVSWWQNEKQLKNQSKEMVIKNPGALANMDTKILLNPDTDFSEESVDPRQKRRSAYVSNRPYNVEERRREIKSVLPWRGTSSRPRG
ncbi:MAG: hypothetical protein HC771_13495 [Synechococcales cyanobacterium CRU_2_2]|nr:hypothetical protein [Synechococcales cyanobacterium CRU_2_2]